MPRMSFLVLSLLLAAGLGQAAVVKTLDLDGLVTESDTIVEGRIVGLRVEWNGKHTSIFTIYTVEADRYLKGFLGATFELAEPGGELDNLAMDVPGVPHFQMDEEAVFFIWTDNLYGRHQVDGLEQGAFRIRKDPITGAKSVNRSAALRASIPGGVATNARVSTDGPPAGRTARDLTQFLAQVSAAVERAGAASKAGVRQ